MLSILSTENLLIVHKKKHNHSKSVSSLISSVGTKKNSDSQDYCACQVFTSSLRRKLQGCDCSFECSTTPLTRKLLILGTKKAWNISVSSHVCSIERDRNDRYFSKVLILFKETPVSMISSIWFRYWLTPIYDL